MSTKRRGSSKRRSVPKFTRWREKTRRLINGLRADLRGRSTYTRKANPGDTEAAKRTPCRAARCATGRTRRSRICAANPPMAGCV